MPKFDPNKIAARILRETLRNHTRVHRERRADYFREWKDAAAVISATPHGTRLRDKQLWRNQLHLVGTVPIIEP